MNSNKNTCKNTQKKILSTIKIILGLSFFIAFYFYIVINNIYPINTALKVDNIKIDNVTYALIKNTLKNENKEITNNSINIFISDTIILSEKAKEIGLTVEKEEYADLVKKYGNFSKNFALREKLIKSLKDTAIVTNQEINYFYENLKNNLFVYNSTIKYCAVQSKKPITSNYESILDKTKIIEGNVYSLIKYGIHNPDEGIYLIDENDNIYKYIIIIDTNIEYIPLNTVKHKIEKAIYKQKTEGKIAEYINEGRLKYKIKYYKQ